MDNLFKNALKELTNIIDEIEAEEDVQYFSEEDTLELTRLYNETIKEIDEDDTEGE